MLIFEALLSNRNTPGDCLEVVSISPDASFTGTMGVDPSEPSSGGSKSVKVDFLSYDFLVGMVRVEIERFHTEAIDPSFGTNSITVRKVSSADTTHRITSADGPWKVFSTLGDFDFVSLPGGNNLAIEDALDGAKWFANGVQFATYPEEIPGDAGDNITVIVNTQINIASGVARPMFSGAIRIYAEPFNPEPVGDFWTDFVGCEEFG